MTTPYEFGAGYTIGNEFVQDPDQVPFWELQWRGENPLTQTFDDPYGNYVAWDTLICENPSKKYLTGDYTGFIVPKTASYAVSVQLNATAVSATAGALLVSVVVIKPSGQTITHLGQNAFFTSSLYSAKLGFNLDMTLEVGDVVKVLGVKSSVDQTLEKCRFSATGNYTKQTFMQIREIADPAPVLNTLIIY